MDTHVKKTELRQVIREEIKSLQSNHINLNEGLVDMIFGKIGKSKAKRVEKELQKDPEFQKLDKDIKKLKTDIENIRKKYKDDKSDFSFMNKALM